MHTLDEALEAVRALAVGKSVSIAPVKQKSRHDNVVYVVTEGGPYWSPIERHMAVRFAGPLPLAFRMYLGVGCGPMWFARTGDHELEAW